ncbi:hypothetical protein Tco_0479491 [Tanacetum coccineum]
MNFCFALLTSQEEHVDPDILQVFGKSISTTFFVSKLMYSKRGRKEEIRGEGEGEDKIGGEESDGWCKRVEGGEVNSDAVKVTSFRNSFSEIIGYNTCVLTDSVGLFMGDWDVLSPVA